MSKVENKEYKAPATKKQTLLMMFVKEQTQLIQKYSPEVFSNKVVKDPFVVAAVALDAMDSFIRNCTTIYELNSH